ncbi:MAG TPA: barstar family protein [Burkholderiales bacterium]|nr:barstar family protein [Burkholderiales bacterium]
MKGDWLKDAARAGVFHLSADARELAGAAASAGLMVIYVDIHHAHDRDDFMAEASHALRFPEAAGASWDSFAGGLKDLSWMQAKGWVVILEKGKHFAGGHRDEFKEAMAAMSAAAEHWRGKGKPFWTLIGGPDGWKSGWPDLPPG